MKYYLLFIVKLLTELMEEVKKRKSDETHTVAQTSNFRELVFMVLIL